MNDQDAEDEGRDEFGGTRCPDCGSTQVRWRQQTGRWVLFSLQPGVEHVCDPDDVTKDFD